MSSAADRAPPLRALSKGRKSAGGGLSDLPEDLLQQVCSRLSTYDVLQVARTCTPLYDAVYGSLGLLLSEISFAGAEEKVVDGTLRHLVRRLSAFRAARSRKLGGKVAVLSLSGCTRVTSHGLLPLLALCGPELQVLDLSGCAPQAVSPALFEALPSLVPNLRVLRLASCSTISTKSLLELERLGPRSSLEVLDISMCNVSQFVLNRLACLPRLRTVAGARKFERGFPGGGNSQQTEVSHVRDMWDAISTDDLACLRRLVGVFCGRDKAARWLVHARWGYSVPRCGSGHSGQGCSRKAAAHCPGGCEYDWRVKGATLLHAAAFEGAPTCCSALIREFGLSPLARDAHGNTPLLYALRGGSSGAQLVLDVLLDAIDEADIDTRSLEVHLMEATELHCLRAVDALLERSGRHAKNADLRAVLFKAATLTDSSGEDNARIVERLMQAGADPNGVRGYNGGKSALHIACESSNVPVVKSLVSSQSERGKSPCTLVCQQDDAGRSALDAACSSADSCAVAPIVYALLCPHVGSPAECPEPRCPGTTRSGFLSALKAGNGLAAKIILQVMPSRIWSLVRVQSVPHALHWIAQNYGRDSTTSNEDLLFCAQQMMRWIRLYTRSNRTGSLPISAGKRIAAYLKRNESARPVVEQPAKLRGAPQADLIDGRDARGRTPLHFAAGSPRTEILQLLLENGARVNAVDRSGQAPAHYAAVSRRTQEALRMLMAFGADTSLRDKSGCTPLVLGLKKNNEVCAHLLSHGTFHGPNRRREEAGYGRAEPAEHYRRHVHMVSSDDDDDDWELGFFTRGRGMRRNPGRTAAGSSSLRRHGEKSSARREVAEQMEDLSDDYDADEFR